MKYIVTYFKCVTNERRVSVDKKNAGNSVSIVFTAEEKAYFLSLDIGTRFKLIRMKKNIRQYIITAKTNITQTYISSFENNRRNLPEEKVKLLFGAIGAEWALIKEGVEK